MSVFPFIIVIMGRTDFDLKRYKEFYQDFGTVRTDTVNSTLSYIGTAKQEAATSDPAWQIKRVSIQGNEEVVEYADEGDFDQIWDNREALFDNIPYYNSLSTFFDGANDYIDCGDNFNFERTDQFSFSFWIRPGATADQTIFMKRSTASSAGIQIKVGSANRLEFFLVNTQTTNQLRVQAASVDALAMNTWYHVVITYAGTSLASGVTLYINNVLKTFTTINDVLSASILISAIARIGSGVGASFVSGHIDEFSIWGKVLTASDVNEIFNDGAPFDLTEHSSTVNLLNWYRMGEQALFPTIPDIVGGIDGTMTNMTEDSFAGVIP